MAFIVETGEGLQDATSYVTIEFANHYHNTYGNSDWPQHADDASEEEIAADHALKSVALIRATKAVDTLYGPRFKSWPFTQEQNLEFPRAAFYLNARQICNSNEIPKALKEAVCEIALKDLMQEDIFPDEENSIKKKKVELDAIKTETEYFSPLKESFTGFTNIERQLKPVLKSEEGVITSLGL